MTHSDSVVRDRHGGKQAERFRMAWVCVCSRPVTKILAHVMNTASQCFNCILGCELCGHASMCAIFLNEFCSWL